MFTTQFGTRQVFAVGDFCSESFVSRVGKQVQESFSGHRFALPNHAIGLPIRRERQDRVRVRAPVRHQGLRGHAVAVPQFRSLSVHDQLQAGGVGRGDARGGSARPSELHLRNRNARLCGRPDHDRGHHLGRVGRRGAVAGGDCDRGVCHDRCEVARWGRGPFVARGGQSSRAAGHAHTTISATTTRWTLQRFQNEHQQLRVIGP